MWANRNTIHEKVFLYVACIITFLLIFSFSHSSFTAIYRIAIIVLSLNWLLQWNLSAIKALKNNMIFLSFALFYLLHVVSLLYTTDVSNGVFQLDKKITLLLLPLVLATTPRVSARHTKVIFKVFISAVLVSSFICLGYAIHRNNYWAMFEHTDWFYFTYNDFTSILNIQPNYLAIYTAFSILILFDFLLTGQGRVRKAILVFTILYLMLILLLLAGRTPILATVGILVSGSLYYFFKQKKLLKGLIITTTLVIAMIIVLYQIPIVKERFLQTFGIEQHATWITQYGDGKGGLPSIRLLKWQCTWNIIKENWFLGVGPSDVQEALQLQYKKINFDVAYDAMFNAHNEYLQTWAGLGVVGLIALVGTFFFSAMAAYKQRAYLFLAFVALFAICSITESTLERQFGIVFYAFFNSLFAFHVLAGKGQDVPQKDRVSVS